MAWKRSTKNAEFTATEKGTKFTMAIYVYPDGHGNLTGKGLDHPVNDPEEAIGAFADLWRTMKHKAANNQKAKNQKAKV